MTQGKEIYGRPAPAKSSASKDPHYSVKRWIWAYFLLLIFEGALRKWVLPGLATPFLVIRDPIALVIIIQVWQKGIFPKSIYLTLTLIIGFVGLLTAVIFGHGSLPVAIYGARMLLIHFPLIFAIGKVMNRKDVIEVGRAILMISIPMAVLIALQFYSPQSAWVNRGIGGDVEGGGFSGAMGFFRPPGTFSFTNGCTSFFAMVMSFVIYFWLNTKEISKPLLIGASIASVIAIPVSISRMLLFSDVLVILFALAATITNSKYASKMILFGIISVISIVVLSQFAFFQTATETITERFSNASESEGSFGESFLDRSTSGLTVALRKSNEMPFFGYGMGMGTSAGSKLLTGKVSYLIAELEWGRLIGELGVVMGLLMIGIRLALTLKLLFSSYKKIGRGDLLPWMMLSFGLTVFPQGQWSQPTSLGFSVLIVGLIFSSMQSEKKLYRNIMPVTGPSPINRVDQTVQMKIS